MGVSSLKSWYILDLMFEMNQLLICPIGNQFCIRAFNLIGYKIDSAQWYYDDQPVNDWNAHILHGHGDTGAGPSMQDFGCLELINLV